MTIVELIALQRKVLTDKMIAATEQPGGIPNLVKIIINQQADDMAKAYETGLTDKMKILDEQFRPSYKKHTPKPLQVNMPLTPKKSSKK